MNRRGFLSFLSAAVAGATLDPELALWKPGAKLISIPKPAPIARYANVSYGVSFECKPLSQVFDELSSSSGFTWSVDPSDMSIHFHEFDAIAKRMARAHQKRMEEFATQLFRSGGPV